MSQLVNELKRRLAGMIRLRRHGDAQRGSGSAMVIGIMVGFALVWGIVYGISNWIYNTSHERDRKNREALVEKKGKHNKRHPPATPTFAPRDAGAYAVKCTGVFSPKCKEIRLRDEE